MKINSLEIEWNEKGCVVKASGFDGVLLTCPRCHELLPRDAEHHCGDRLKAPSKKPAQRRKRSSQP
jgi:hypothetical protein